MILLWYLAAWIQILSKRFVQSLGFFLYFSFSVSSFYFQRDNFLMISIFSPPILQSGLCSGNLLRFAISDGGLSSVDGKLVKADLHYLEKPNRARAFADSYSKVSWKIYPLHTTNFSFNWLMILTEIDTGDHDLVYVKVGLCVFICVFFKKKENRLINHWTTAFVQLICCFDTLAMLSHEYIPQWAYILLIPADITDTSGQGFRFSSTVVSPWMHLGSVRLGRCKNFINLLAWSHNPTKVGS